MLTSTSLLAIEFYQKYISPKKGFSCAYRIAHNDHTGCSGFAKQKIRDVGLIRAIPEIRKRLKACREAAEEIQSQRQQKNRKEKHDSGVCAGAEACDCGEALTCGSRLSFGKGMTKSDAGDCNIGHCDGDHCDGGPCS